MHYHTDFPIILIWNFITFNNPLQITNTFNMNMCTWQLHCTSTTYTPIYITYYEVSLTRRQLLIIIIYYIAWTWRPTINSRESLNMQIINQPLNIIPTPLWCIYSTRIHECRALLAGSLVVYIYIYAGSWAHSYNIQLMTCIDCAQLYSLCGHRPNNMH